MNEKITLGKWSEDRIDAMLSEASKIRGSGARIAFLSRHFIDTPYMESTLVGGPEIPEKLVVNLTGLDCFTFIDYIEAMRLSRSFREFMERLRAVRYRDGIVAYKNRNHFFTDWREFNRPFIKDVTQAVGGNRTRKIKKILNLKPDGTLFLSGIEPLARMVDYIPSSSFDSSVAGALKSGDYVGIYTDSDGIDVSHVGIIIRKINGTFMRHASSAPACRKVTEQFFHDYLKEKPGAVIFRPRAS